MDTQVTGPPLLARGLENATTLLYECCCLDTILTEVREPKYEECCLAGAVILGIFQSTLLYLHFNTVDFMAEIGLWNALIG